MSAEVETMAFAGERPWHGLGNEVNPNTTVDEMLVAAGLDWTVSMRKLFTESKDGKKIILPLKRALVRDSDDKVLGVAGDYWKPFQNKDAMEFFREYTESGGARLETAGSLHGGKLIWALATINKGFKVKGSGGRDEVKGHILLASHHAVGRANSVRTTATRVVCWNTFQMAMNDQALYSQSHTKKFDCMAAKERVQLAVDQVAKLGMDANKLAALKLSDYDSTRLLAKFFQPAPEGVTEEEHIKNLLNDPKAMSKSFAGVMNSFEHAPGATPGNGWGVFNAVTHYVDHVAGNQSDARLYNAWFGPRAETKQEVMTELLEMCS